MLSLRALAHALGGEVDRNQVRAPGPYHSPKDRSMWVRLSPQAPDGILCGSFASQDWRECKDYVRQRLGIARDETYKAAPSTERVAPSTSNDDVEKIKRARIVWSNAQSPYGTLVETYLKSRALILPDDIDHVIRFHPATAWKDEASGELIHVPCMIAAFRNIDTNEITGIHRTRLSPEGKKLGRRMFGIAGGAAIKLDRDEHATTGLVLGEGIETCIAARQIGFRPVWAMGSVGSIASLPVLSGIEGLTLLAETGEASARAIDACGTRWFAAGRDVVLVDPLFGSDVNDALRGAAA